MKFCSKCGKQLMDEAVICPGCGCAQPTTNAPASTAGPVQSGAMPGETSGLATCAMVFAFLMPIVGLILGIIGCNKYKTPAFQKKCKNALIISGVWLAIGFALTAAGL